MSEEKSEDSIEFDLDDILEEDISDENLPEIVVEQIVEETSDDSTNDDGATFEDQVREYMGELDDEGTDSEGNAGANDGVVVILSASVAFGTQHYGID